MSLFYSTYLGGSGSDEAKGVAVDSVGKAYVAGTTLGYPSQRNQRRLVNNFPTKNAVQRSYRGGTSDGFVVKVNPAAKGMKSLIYSTYVGGGGQDVVWDMSVRSVAKKGSRGQGEAYLTGFTDSGDDPATAGRDGPKPYFPTTSRAFDRSFNGRATRADASTTFLNGDSYVTKLSASGKKLSYSTFLGGTDGDVGHGIAVDKAGRAYVVGYTACDNRTPTGPPCPGSFPILNAIFPRMDGTFNSPALHTVPTDVFVANLAADGGRLLYSTYLPGNQFDRGLDIALFHDQRAVLVTGRTTSTNFPTTAGAFQTTKPDKLERPAPPPGARDAFVSKITN